MQLVWLGDLICEKLSNRWEEIHLVSQFESNDSVVGYHIIQFSFLGLSDFDFVFPENGLIAYKNGKEIAKQVVSMFSLWLFPGKAT